MHVEGMWESAIRERAPSDPAVSGSRMADPAFHPRSSSNPVRPPSHMSGQGKFERLQDPEQENSAHMPYWFEPTTVSIERRRTHR